MPLKRKFYIIIIPILIFSGCRYKEGPLISFRSIEKRIKGTWEIVGLTSDGVDSTQYYKDSCGGNMQVLWDSSSPDRRGSFNFINGKKDLSAECHFDGSDFSTVIDVNFGNQNKIIGPIGNGKSSWKILKLTMKNFKISTDINGKTYVISFKKE